MCTHEQDSPQQPVRLLAEPSPKPQAKQGSVSNTLKIKVHVDAAVEAVCSAFDLSLKDGHVSFDVPQLPEIPDEFEIGLITGPSGTGKTTLLNQRFGSCFERCVA